MSSDLIRFLADSADELVAKAQRLPAAAAEVKLAEASEMLCLAAHVARRSARQSVDLREAA